MIEILYEMSRSTAIKDVSTVNFNQPIYYNDNVMIESEQDVCLLE